MDISAVIDILLTEAGVKNGEAMEPVVLTQDQELEQIASLERGLAKIANLLIDKRVRLQANNKGQRDKRFLLIITPQQEKYLSYRSLARREKKADIVRDALDSVMFKDKEYLAFLKDEKAHGTQDIH